MTTNNLKKLYLIQFLTAYCKSKKILIQISKLQNGNTVFSFEGFFFEHFLEAQSDLDLNYSFSAKLKE